MIASREGRGISTLWCSYLARASTPSTPGIHSRDNIVRNRQRRRPNGRLMTTLLTSPDTHTSSLSLTPVAPLRFSFVLCLVYCLDFHSKGRGSYLRPRQPGRSRVCVRCVWVEGRRGRIFLGRNRRPFRTRWIERVCHIRLHVRGAFRVCM